MFILIIIGARVYGTNINEMFKRIAIGTRETFNCAATVKST